MKRKDLLVIAGVVIFFVITSVLFLRRGFSVSSPSVAVLRISGTISRSEPIVRWLGELTENTKIKGLLIYINSPGGSAVSADEIYRAILRFKEKGKRPVIAYISQVGASGGYYIACAADKIVVNPSSITGSIGVIAEFPEFSGLLKKVGVKIRVIKSGGKKDIGSPFRHMTSEEKKIIENIINQVYLRFIEVVSSARGLSKDSTRILADGRIYSGSKAVEIGLCDTTGDFITARELMKKALKVSKIKEVKMKKPFSIKDAILKSDLPYSMVISYRMVP